MGLGLQGRVSHMVAGRSTVAIPSPLPCPLWRSMQHKAQITWGCPNPSGYTGTTALVCPFYRVQVCQNHFGSNCPTWETRIHSDSCPVCVTGAQSCVPESHVGLSAGQLMALRDPSVSVFPQNSPRKGWVSP